MNGRTAGELAARIDQPLNVVQTNFADWLKMGVVTKIGDGYKLTTLGYSYVASLHAADPTEPASAEGFLFELLEAPVESIRRCSRVYSQHRMDTGFRSWQGLLSLSSNH